MSQSFRCGKCGTLLEADTRDIGQPVECPECHFGFEVPRQRLGPGVKLGGFTIESLLGRGGMGEVYLARQVSMDRQVALKVLPAHLTADPERVKRFLAEVRNSARLDHPNIVSAHEAGDDGGTYYLAMTYVRGESLERKLRREGPLPEAQALGIVRKVACALAYAWAQHRMLHRDIKPANVMLDSSGEPRLLDMGLSKCLDDQASLTLSSAVMGTPNYMSPEQAEGRGDLDFRTDLYSLGAMLYHMLTGELPFAGSSLMETLRKQVSEKLPDPRTRNAGVSEAAVAVLERMLAKKKEKRHESWEALIAEIDRVLAGRKPEARPLDPGDSMMMTVRDGRTLPMPPAEPHRQGGKLVVHVKGGHMVGAAAPVSPPAADPAKKAAPPKPAVTAAPAKKRPTVFIAVAAAAVLAIPAVWLALRGGNRPPKTTPPPPAASTIPRPPPPVPSSSDAFTREIAALSPGEQVIRVAKKLKELNPKFDGRIGYKSETAMLKISDPAAADLAPLRALPWLKELVCDPAALAKPANQAALRTLPSLATINGAPATEFWKTAETVAAPRTPPPAPAADDAFVKEVAALPREEQVRRVALKLKELNPQFDGQVTSSDLNDQSRAGIQFSGSGVSTIAPVRALPWLASLHIKGTKKPSELADLSPLRGLKLRGLILSYTCVSDLSSLRDMPLETADFYYCPIVDLSPLTGSPLGKLSLVFTQVRSLDSLRTLRLTSLSLNGSPVTDLTPLRGMPLKLLNIHGTHVRDLGPVAGMPLTSFHCGSTPVNDLSPLRNLPLRSLEVWPDQLAPPANIALLRSMKSLETINDLPAAEFWKQVDAGKTPSAVEQPRQTMDLLALTDPVKDRVRSVGGTSPSRANQWERRDGVLRYESDGYSGKLAPPVAINARSFEIEVGYERLSGSGRLHVDFPFEGTKIIPVYLDATGFKIINMKAGVTWPSGKGPRGRGVIRLDRSADGNSDHITVRVDNELALDWTGNVQDVLHPGGEPHPDFPGQPVTSLYSHKDSYKITDWTLRVFDGEARVLRTPAVADDWKDAIDLLPLIDPQKDAVFGTWTPSGGDLVVENLKGARIEIPYRAPQEYDLRVVCTMESGGFESGQILTGGGNAFAWKMGAYTPKVCCLDLVGTPEDRDPRVKSERFPKAAILAGLGGPFRVPVAVQMTPPSRTAFTSTVHVRRDGVSADIDGRLILSYKTAFSDMRLETNWVLRTPGVLGLYSHGTRTLYHRIQVREVTGKGTFTRAAPAPWLDAFCAEIARLPAEEQVKRVVAEVKRLNPGFDPGTVKHEISGNHDVATFAFCSTGVTNLSPVRALARLYRLDCSGPKEGRRSPLQDLSPLRGLRLKYFFCQYTEVADLSPLHGMPLESVTCFNTRVEDLTPLQGMPLKGLNCMSTEVGTLEPLATTRQLEELVLHGNRRVRDLTPLRGLPLKSLTISGTSVSDVSPLAGMPLERIICDSPVVDQPANAKALRSIATLTSINKQPAAEFWKQVDAGRRVPATPGALARPSQLDQREEYFSGAERAGFGDSAT